MRLGKKAKRSHLKFAFGGIQKTKQFALRATSQERLSLQSAISHLVFGHRRRCASDDDIDSGLGILLEVAQVEVVGAQFHFTC